MTAPVHLEGFGWFGAVLGYHLDAAGIPFTWNDTDEPVNAWQASTGIVYPAGDERSQTNLAAFPRFARALPQGNTAAVDYWYAHKNPPHQGRYAARSDLGWIRQANASCYAVDVPGTVRAARRAFASRRVPVRPHGARRIIAHGHDPARRGSWVWGWSAPVQLALPDKLTARNRTGYTALYGRAHRYAICYAYPITTRPGWWLAGSDLVNQRSPGTGKPVEAFDRWQRHVRTVYAGHVHVTNAEPATVGWRPKPHSKDSGLTERHADGTISIPPLWHSGIRWAPLVVQQAIDMIEAG